MARESVGRLLYSVWHCFRYPWPGETFGERFRNAVEVIVHWIRNDVQEG